MRRFVVACYYMIFGGLGWTRERDAKALAQWAKHPPRLKRQARQQGCYRPNRAERVAATERFFASFGPTPEQVAAAETRQARILMTCGLCEITSFDEAGEPYGCPLRDDEWSHEFRAKDSECHYTLEEFERVCAQEIATGEKRLRDIRATLEKRRILKEQPCPTL